MMNKAFGLYATPEGVAYFFLSIIGCNGVVFGGQEIDTGGQAYRESASNGATAGRFSGGSALDAPISHLSSLSLFCLVAG
jgi:hypothetical protein